MGSPSCSHPAMRYFGEATVISAVKVTVCPFSTVSPLLISVPLSSFAMIFPTGAAALNFTSYFGVSGVPPFPFELSDGLAHALMMSAAASANAAVGTAIFLCVHSLFIFFPLIVYCYKKLILIEYIRF